MPDIRGQAVAGGPRNFAGPDLPYAVPVDAPPRHDAAGHGQTYGYSPDGGVTWMVRHSEDAADAGPFGRDSRPREAEHRREQARWRGRMERAGTTWQEVRAWAAEQGRWQPSWYPRTAPNRVVIRAWLVAHGHEVIAAEEAS